MSDRTVYFVTRPDGGHVLCVIDDYVSDRTVNFVTRLDGGHALCVVDSDVSYKTVISTSSQDLMAAMFCM